ncbi:MAG: hypothetical protein GTO02_14640, partial [Candidatus Dadabacteria bacterium]|nr:hypothetical protein [Candidatus Dadabacteria bacterium]
MLSIVREYGYLSSTGESNGLDFVRLPDKEFNSLQEQALNWPESLTPIFRLRNHQGYRCLQVLNYVGLIETPNGYQVEILPKVTRNEDSIDHLRRLLRNMLTIVFDIKYIDTGAAKLGTLPQTWLESLIELFLVEVTNLVHKGIKKQY